MRSLWFVPEAGYIMALRSCSAVHMLLPLIISIWHIWITWIEHLLWEILGACLNTCWVYSVETVSKIESVDMLKYLLGIFCRNCIYDVVIFLGYLPYFCRNMCGCICQTCPFKFRWSEGYSYNSSYYHHHHEIRSINLSHCCHISVAVCLRWLHHHMLSISYIPGKLGFVSIIIVQSYDVRKQSRTLLSNGCIRLFAHYITSSP